MDVVANELRHGSRRDPPEAFPRARPSSRSRPSCGLTYDSGNYQGALAKARELAELGAAAGRSATPRARPGGSFGIGVSTYVEICAMGPSKAMPAGGWEWGCVRMEISGKVTVITGVSPHGQGQETTLRADRRRSARRADRGCRRAARRHQRRALRPRHLRQPRHGGRRHRDRHVRRQDHREGQDAGGASARDDSRSRGVRERDVQRAGRDDARDRAGRNWRARRTSRRTCRRASSRASKRRVSSSRRTSRSRSARTSCAVEVDRDTGEVAISKYVAVDDCGPQINPLLVEGQVQGGIAHSIGQVLFEQTRLRRERPAAHRRVHGLRRCRAPRTFPTTSWDSTVTPSPVNPLGVKGVGEAGTIGATPAIANAVHRRARAARRHASRSAADARARLARHSGSRGGSDDG